MASSPSASPFLYPFTINQNYEEVVHFSLRHVEPVWVLNYVTGRFNTCHTQCLYVSVTCPHNSFAFINTLQLGQSWLNGE